MYLFKMPNINITNAIAVYMSLLFLSQTAINFMFALLEVKTLKFSPNQRKVTKVTECNIIQ